jgi:hypothetical protein
MEYYISNDEYGSLTIKLFNKKVLESEYDPKIAGYISQEMIFMII